MRKPPSLESGMRVGLVSTARSISSKELEPAVKIIQAWGLEPVLGKSIGVWEDQFAGTDELRVRDLQTMLDDDGIRAIFFARGGYGTARIVDHIDFKTFTEKPKWLVGYSDITVLHSHIQRKLEIQTLHGSMPIDFEGNTPGAINSIKTILFGEYPDYAANPHRLNRFGKNTGTLCGGNLSVLYSINGTPSEVSTEGKILLLEDLDEYLYHVDRMMVSFKRGAKLSKLAGLIVGAMTEMNDNQIPFGKTAEEIVAEHTMTFDYPVCFGFPAGHAPDNRALILGAEVVLEVGDAGGKLSYV